jgi:hypothetical protein
MYERGTLLPILIWKHSNIQTQARNFFRYCGPVWKGWHAEWQAVDGMKGEEENIKPFKGLSYSLHGPRFLLALPIYFYPKTSSSYSLSMATQMQVT